MNPQAGSRRFRSPWQSRVFVAAVAAARLVLRPFPRLEERFIGAVVAAQNRRVGRHLQPGAAPRALLIMPRCVKKTGCHAPVQESLDHCLECMQCPLGDVAVLCRDHGVQALVAFRSQIAFDMARRVQPDLIIASACHDRMIKALRSTPEFPALLAPLTGMERPCRDAAIDLPWLRDQLARIGDGRPAAPAPARAARES